MCRFAIFCVVIGGLFALAGCGGPPQVTGDPEAFKEVDALYTAVTAKSPKLLDQCEQRLRDLRSQGKLSEPALRALEPIIARARKGDWRPAAEDLTTFMRGQRKPRK